MRRRERLEKERNRAKGTVERDWRRIEWTQSRTKIDYIAEPLRITQQTPSLVLPASLFHLSGAQCIRDPNHDLPFRRGLIFCHPLPFIRLIIPLLFYSSLCYSVHLSPGPSYLLSITTVLRSLVRWQKVFQYLSNEAKLPCANPDLYPRRRRPRGLANIAVTSKPCARRDGSVAVDRATDIFVRRIPGNLIRKREFWSLAICCDSP